MVTVAVAGATGTVGKHVVTSLRYSGHRAVPLSRSGGIDVAAGTGLREALRDVDAVIDVLNVATQSTRRAEHFFGTTTTSLLDAERAAGVGHHVLLSIVGIDRVPVGYYAGKLRQESLVMSGDVPWTILRATQFHEFAQQMLATVAIGPVSFIPTARVRPVAAREVGTALADLAGAAPQRVTRSVRGPHEESLVDMARRVVSAQGSGRRVVPVRPPGRLGRAMRDGALLGDATADEGVVTFTDWLAAREDEQRS